jgi:hypothetical protein
MKFYKITEYTEKSGAPNKLIFQARYGSEAVQWDQALKGRSNKSDMAYFHGGFGFKILD